MENQNYNQQGQYNQQSQGQYGQQGQYYQQSQGQYDPYQQQGPYNPQQPNGPYNCPPNAASNKILCGILAILIGGLGIHYFIMGKTTAGILTIVLSLVTCGLWTLVMFVQGILILCMSDQEFVQKYICSPKSFPLF